MNIDNKYKNKYIKYKEKYLLIKNSIGGFDNNKINFGDCLGSPKYDIDIKYFNFTGFQSNEPYGFLDVGLDKKKLINLKKEKVDKTIIFNYGSDIKFTFTLIDEMNTDKLNCLNKKYKVNINLDEDKYIIEYFYKDKIRCILTSNKKIFFLVDIVFVENLYTGKKEFFFNDNVNKIYFEGEYELIFISKNNKLKLNLKKINSTDISYLDSQIDKLDIEIKNRDDYSIIFNISFESDIEETKKEIKPFDFETFYDNSIKKLKICNQSQSLVKNFSSSFVNLMYVKYDFIKILVNKYPRIFENILLEIIQGNKSNMNSNCLDNTDRQFLLTNILKKLNTFVEDVVEISVKKRTGEEFVKISNLTSNSGNTFRVILDSGNSNTTIIGTNFANALKHPQEKSVKIKSIGVVKDVVSTVDTKINLKLRFDNKNIDIGKIYEIEAYVSPTFDPDTLLIGNFDDSLTRIFSTSYCIGYEYSRNKYQTEKSLFTVNFEEFDKIIQKINDFNTSGEFKNNDVKVTNEYSKLLSEFISLLNDLINSKKYLSIEDKKKFNDIYIQLPQIKDNINLILQDDSTYSDYKVKLNKIKEIMNDII